MGSWVGNSKTVSFLALGLLFATGQAVDAAAALSETSSNSMKQGEALAHQYCAVCHLFPEPDLLDKKTWANQTFRKMAPFLGVSKIRMEGRPDGRRLEESHLFPPTPLLSEAEWHVLREYYINSAPSNAIPQAARPIIVPRLDQFIAEKLTISGAVPLTTLVHIDASAHEVVLGDMGIAGLVTFRADGSEKMRTVLEGAPVGLVQFGDQRLATLIGHVFPSDVADGKVVVLPMGQDRVQPGLLLSGLERPTQSVVADLNGDGRLDLLVCSFGNYLGRLSWFEQKADGKFEPHLLLESPGAIRAEVRDLDGDGRPEIVVLMAQGREGLFLFANQGQGEFLLRPLLQFQPAYGATYFEFADMNNDGLPDVVMTNGDNGEYPSPFKRYHGVRIFLNDGKLGFTEAYFFPMNGAFKVVARDFDGDGDLDLAAISFFPDYGRSPEESFVYLENLSGLRFVPRSFPGATAGRWLTMDAGDLDGDGDMDLVLGAFSQGPPGIEITPGLQASWQTNGVNGLILRNTRVRSKP